MGQLNQTIFADCPKVDIRQSMPTKTITELATILNFKKVVFKVPSYEIKKGGYFSSDYSLFNVEIEIAGGVKHKV